MERVPVGAAELAKRRVGPAKGGAAVHLLGPTPSDLAADDVSELSPEQVEAKQQRDKLLTEGIKVDALPVIDNAESAKQLLTHLGPKCWRRRRR